MGTEGVFMSDERFFDDAQRVDQLLLTPDPRSAIPDLVSLIGRRGLREYFFTQIPDTRWLVPLMEAGFFTNPPDAEVASDGRGIVFPAWPESRYLSRVAGNDPEKVMAVIIRVPITNNVQVHLDFTGAVLAMTADMAAKWAQVETEWVEGQDYIYSLLPQKLGDLVLHLAGGGEARAALALTAALLALRPSQREVDTLEPEPKTGILHEPKAKIDTWDYEQVIEKCLPVLVAGAGMDALNLFCQLMEKAVRLSGNANDEKEDYSYIWRPAIEDHEQNTPHDIKDFLVNAVRNSAELLSEQDHDKIGRIVNELEARRWSVFRRISLHLVRRFQDVVPTLVADRLMDPELLDNYLVRHEYYLLAKECFGKLSPELQGRILNFIGDGLRDEEIQERWIQQNGDQASSEQVERIKKTWQRDRLTSIEAFLPPEWKKRYDELVSELGPPRHPDFVSVVTTWTGPTSPKNPQELGSMPIPNLVSYLREWRPSGSEVDSSSEGLGRILAPIVSSRANEFAGAASQFKGLEPTYVRFFFDGLRQAVKEGKRFNWTGVLGLAQWVLDQPREIPGRTGPYADLDPGWVWTRKEIASLITDGLAASETSLSLELREQVWSIIAVLAEDPDPTPAHEAKYGGSNMNPATLSINTVRGQAMHAVVRYGLWIVGHLNKQPDGAARLARGFNEMPEMRNLLEAHLDPTRDPSEAVRSVYGQWFPWLVLLDKTWVGSWVDRIFPVDPALRKLRDAAWNTYIVFCQPYDPVFEILERHYLVAIDQLSLSKNEDARLPEADKRLTDHLMALYWRGRIRFGEQEGLLNHFFTKASTALRRQAIWFVGRSLYDDHVAIEIEIIQRLKQLWEWRFAIVSAAGNQAQQTDELEPFGWWFASRKFDDEWSITQLLQVVQTVQKIDPSHRVFERLAQVAPAYPLKSLNCLELLVKRARHTWDIFGWEDHVRTILEAVLKSSDAEAQEAAIDLVHQLGAMGHLGFRDLLDRTAGM